jgi:hypothetical protein
LEFDDKEVCDLRIFMVFMVDDIINYVIQIIKILEATHSPSAHYQPLAKPGEDGKPAAQTGEDKLQ